MSRTFVTSNGSDGSDKDVANNQHKTNSNNLGSFEQHPDDSDKASSTSSQTTSKNVNMFDYNGFSLFCKGNTHQSKPSNDSSQGKSHSKKISTESNSNKDNSLKSTALKESNPLEELLENTTVVQPTDLKSHSKKKSCEATNTNKIQGDEHADNQTIISESSTVKAHGKKKSADKGHMSSSLKGYHSKEPSNDIDALEKQGPTERDEASDKVADPNNFKEKAMSSKPPKHNNALNENIIERIKSKVHHRSGSSTSLLTVNTTTTETTRTNNNSIFKAMKPSEEKVTEKTEKIPEKSEGVKIKVSTPTNPVFASSPIIYNYKNQEIYADGTEAASNPVFKYIFGNNGPNPKAENQNLGLSTQSQSYIVNQPDKKKNDLDDDTSFLTKDIFAQNNNNGINPEFLPFIVEPQTPFSTPRLDVTANPHSNLPQWAINSQNLNNNSYIIPTDIADSVWKQTPPKPKETTTFGVGGGRTKPNLSWLSTESTIDSDFTTANEHNNNSFNTHFSGQSNSLNNSGKIDFSSPTRLDSNRLIQEGLQTQMHMNQQKQYFMFPTKPAYNTQRLTQLIPHQNTNSARLPMNLNQSCIGAFGQGNSFSDHSSSFSFNNDDYSAFGSNYSTPQGRQQQNFLNQHQSFSVLPTNKKDNFFLAPPEMNNMMHMGNMMNPNPVMMQQNRTPTGMEQFTNNLTPTGASTASLSQKSPCHQQQQQQQHNIQNIQNIPGKSTTASRLKKKNADNDDSSSVFDIEVTKVDEFRRTTLMIKNIPNKYDRNLILQTIDKNHKGKYDFFYLPIDFRNRCNVGYAFINFTETKHIRTFYEEFNGKRWEKFNSEKICVLKYARIQGRAALIQHFQFSSVMNQQDKKLKPLILANQHNLTNIEQLVKQQRANLENDS